MWAKKLTWGYRKSQGLRPQSTDQYHAYFRFPIFFQLPKIGPLWKCTENVTVKVEVQKRIRPPFPVYVNNVMFLNVADLCWILPILIRSLTDSLNLLTTRSQPWVLTTMRMSLLSETEYILFQSLVMGWKAAIGRAAVAAIFANLANICNFMQCEWSLWY